MPNIQEFNATDSTPLRPSSTGSDAFAMEGRKVGAFYHQIGTDLGGAVKDVGQEYDRHITQQQMLQGTATLTKMHAAELDDWNNFEKNADPNDHSAVQAFRDKWDQQYQTLTDHFSTDEGKAWATSAIARQRESMYETTAAGASSMAGIAASVNLQQTVNQASANAFMDSSDKNIVTQLAMVHDAAKAAGMGANMSAETAAKISADVMEKGSAAIMVGAYRSRAAANPEAAKAALAGDPRAQMYLNEDQRHGIEDYADAQSRAHLVDQERQRQMGIDQAKDKSEAKSGLYLSALGGANTADPNFLADWNKHVLTDTDLLPATRDSLQAMGERLVRQGTETLDRGNVLALEGVVHDVAGGKHYTDAQIYDMVKPGGLNVSQAETAIKIANPKTPLGELDGKMLSTTMSFWKEKYPATNPNSHQPNKANQKAFEDMNTFYLPLIQQGLTRGIPMQDLIADPGPDHPNSIYNARAVDSWKPAPPAAGATPPHTIHPQGNIWDGIGQAWRGMAESTGGGSTDVKTPIAGSVKGQYDAITATKPGQKPWSSYFSGQ